jgi:hypothetical protein
LYCEILPSGKPFYDRYFIVYSSGKKHTNMLKSTFLTYALLFIFTGHIQPVQNTPFVIEGRVLDENGNKPLNDAHVYILDGEEEALTNNKGEFKIRSWQKAPFKLTVEKYNGYQKQIIVITDPSQKQVIRLKK